MTRSTTRSMTSSTNTQSNTARESPLNGHGIVPATMPEARLMYWSVRRELWENRSLYLAPLAAAALGMLAFLITLIYLPEHMNGQTTHDSAPDLVMVAMPYGHTAWLLMMTAFIVGVFYSLDALHGERR